MSSFSSCEFVPQSSNISIDETDVSVKKFFRITIKVDPTSNTDSILFIAFSQNGFNTPIYSGATGFSLDCPGKINKLGDVFHISFKSSIYLEYGEKTSIYIYFQDISGSVSAVASIDFTTESYIPQEFFLVTDTEGIEKEQVYGETASTATSEAVVKKDSLNTGNLNIVPVEMKSINDTEYTVEIIENGRTDTNLNSSLIKEKELGIGKIKYNEEIFEKGSFYPPKYQLKIDHLGTSTTYGQSLDLGETWAVDGDDTYQVEYLSGCRYSEDEIMAIVHEASVGQNILYIQSTTNLTINSKTINPSFIPWASDFVAAAASSDDFENKIFLIFDSNINATKATVVSTDIGLNSLSKSILDIDKILPKFMHYITSDVTYYRGMWYAAIGYKDTTEVRKIAFLKSSDAKAWNLIYQYGSFQDLADIGNPIKDYSLEYDTTNIFIDPKDSEVGRGYFSPKFFVDETNDELLIVLYGGILEPSFTYVGGNVVILRTTNLIDFKLDKLFKRSNFAQGWFSLGEDLNNSKLSFKPAGGIARGIMSIYIPTDSGMYNYYFDTNDRSGTKFNVQGLVKGNPMLYASSSTINGVIYTLFSTYSGVFAVDSSKGISLTVQGQVTNEYVISKTHYSHVYLGNICSPEKSDFDWTKTGSAVVEVSPDGFVILSNNSVNVTYERSISQTLEELNYRYSKFRIKMSSDISSHGMSIDSPNNPGVEFSLLSTYGGSSYLLKFQLKVSEDEVMIKDNNGGTSTILSVTKPVGIVNHDIFIYVDHRNESCVVSVRNQEGYELWEKFDVSSSHSIQYDTDASHYIKFGNIDTPTSSTAIRTVFEMIAYQEDFGDCDIDRLSINDSADERFPLCLLPRKQTQIAAGSTFMANGLDADKGDNWVISKGDNFHASQILSASTQNGWIVAGGNRTVQIDAGDSRRFSADTFIIKGATFNSCTLKAGDNSNMVSWSKSITLPFLYTVIAYRDCTTGTYLKEVVFENDVFEWGELIGKNLVFSGGPSDERSYTILDNTPRTLTYYSYDNNSEFSAGQIFNIHDTDTVITLDKVITFQYFGLETFSDVLRIRDDFYYKLNTFDFGIRMNLDEKYYYPNSETIDEHTKSSDYEGHLVTDKLSGRTTREFELNYNALMPEDNNKIQALYKKSVDEGKRFWYVPSPIGKRKSYYVQADRNLSDNRLFDADSVKLVLKEV